MHDSNDLQFQSSILPEVWCPGFAGNQWLAVLTLQFTRGIREVSERGLAAYGVGASLVAAQITEY